MRTTSRLAGAVLVALVGQTTISARAEAQLAGAADLTPYVGYLITGNLLEGPLGVSVGSAGGALYGVQASLPLGNGLSLFGNVARSKADLEVGVPFLGGVRVGDVETMLFDGGVRLTMQNGIGATGALVPFFQLGVGAVRHDVDIASYLTTRATNIAFNAGIGAHYAIFDGLGLRVLASDYIGRFDAEEATALDLATKTAHNFALVGGITIEF